jgi:transketolase
VSGFRGVLESQAAARSIVVLYADAIPGEIQGLALAPERVINVGIAESTLVSVAAGLASTGHRPVVFGLAPFLASHAYASLRQDIALDALAVTFVGFAGGGALADMGPTHCTLDDVGLISLLPSFELAVASGRNTAAGLLEHLLRIDGPGYLRIDSTTTDDTAPAEPGEGIQVLRKGDDAMVIVTGGVTRNVLAAVDELRTVGVSAGVLAVLKLRPLDAEAIRGVLRDTPVLIVEEHLPNGGLVSLLLAEIPELSCRALRHVTPSWHNPSRLDPDELRVGAREIRRNLEELINQSTPRGHDQTTF